VTKARNDLGSPVPKFCLGLETSRRTTEGRVRTAGDFLTHFFPHSDASAEDRIFRFLPRDVRGPMLTAWGVRAQKSALRDSDDKVRSVVHDALVAGDLDAATFEDTLAAEVVVRWVDLPSWWAFWRGGKLGKYSILKALESAYELGLLDAEWFLETVKSKDGKLRGTDILCEGLSKADLTEWIRTIYQSSDGTPKGIVAAIGWDQIVAKTADEVLVLVLDAMATKVGLKEEGAAAEAAKPANAKSEVAGAKGEVAAAKSEVAIVSAGTGDGAKKEDLGRGVPLDTWTPAGIPADKTDASPEIPKLPGVIIPNTVAKPAEPRLPGILIPASARTNDPPPAPASSDELTGEAAASLFKDDEMIPISSETWEEDNDPAAHGKPPSVRPGPPNKKDGKRPSKVPPARGAKV
jgi:hypothetical protein